MRNESLSSSIRFQELNGRVFVRLVQATRNEGLSTSVRYEELIRWEFVCLVRSRTKGELVLVCPVRGIKLAGLRQSSTKLRETRAWPCPYGYRNQVGGFSSVRYEVARNEDLSSSMWYVESSKRDFILSVRSHAKGEHVLVRLVRGIKQAGLHPSGTKFHKESFSTFFHYGESSMRDFVRPVRGRATGEHVLVCSI